MRQHKSVIYPKRQYRSRGGARVGERSKFLLGLEWPWCVRQRIGILIARANAEFILAMNSGDDINGSCLKEYNSRQFAQREEYLSLPKPMLRKPQPYLSPGLFRPVRRHCRVMRMARKVKKRSLHVIRARDTSLVGFGRNEMRTQSTPLWQALREEHRRRALGGWRRHRAVIKPQLHGTGRAGLACRVAWPTSQRLMTRYSQRASPGKPGNVPGTSLRPAVALTTPPPAAVQAQSLPQPPMVLIRSGELRRVAKGLVF